MALSNFQKAISEITGRNGNLFALDTVPVTDHWHNIGILRDTTLKCPPRNTSRDNSGREFQYGYEVNFEAHLMQTSLDRLAFLSDLIDDSSNGITLKLTDRPAAEGDVGAVGTADDAVGVKFVNVICTVEPNLSYGDGESEIIIRFTGYVPKDAFDSFDATGGTLTFDQ